MFAVLDVSLPAAGIQEILSVVIVFEFVITSKHYEFLSAEQSNMHSKIFKIDVFVSFSAKLFKFKIV
jgi:hypothetical protein